MLLDCVEPIGHQASIGDKISKWIDRWQVQSGSQRNDQVLVDCVEWARCNDEPAIRFLRKCRDGRLDFCSISHARGDPRLSRSDGSCFGRAHKYNVGGKM